MGFFIFPKKLHSYKDAYVLMREKRTLRQRPLLLSALLQSLVRGRTTVYED